MKITRAIIVANLRDGTLAYWTERPAQLLSRDRSLAVEASPEECEAWVLDANRTMKDFGVLLEVLFFNVHVFARELEGP